MTLSMSTVNEPEIRADRVTRIEIIAANGRVYTSGARAFQGVRMVFQDDDRTLKIFAVSDAVEPADAWDAAIDEACGPDYQKARSLKDANPYR